MEGKTDTHTHTTSLANILLIDDFNWAGDLFWKVQTTLPTTHLLEFF